MPKSNNLIANITTAFSKLFAGICGRGLYRLLYNIKYNCLRDTILGVIFKIVTVIALAI